MTFEIGKVIATEEVSGSAGEVTEARGIGEITADRTFRMKTEHLKEGKWQPSRDAAFREDAAAKIVFE